MDKPEISLTKAKTQASFVPGRVGATIEAKINGRPVKLLIDTGAQGFVHVSELLAEEFKLPVVGSIPVKAGSDASKKMDMVEVGELTIGGLSIKKATALVLPLNADRKKGEPRFDGIIGFEMFQDMLLTLDFPGKKAIFEDRLLSVQSPNCSPMLMIAGHPSVEMTIGAEKMAVSLDSGNGSGFDLPTQFAERLKLVQPPKFTGMVSTVVEKRLKFTGTLDGNLTVCGHVVPKPDFVFSEIFTYPNAGSEFMQPFVIRFDTRSKLIQFQR